MSPEMMVELPDRPALVVVSGLPGTGKTTISRSIADEYGIVHLRTDTIRKELYGTPSYTEVESEEVYVNLLMRAEELLKKGKGVVLDGTFKQKEMRDRAARLADDYHAFLVFIKVTCDEEEVRRRLKERESGASDATYAVYKQMDFEPYERGYIRVDTTGQQADQ